MLYSNIFLIACLLWFSTKTQAQRNLLLNGDFEHINNCAEYHSECGVEAWFYMSAVKVQLSHANNNHPVLGNNTLTVFYDCKGTNSFYPVLGTLLPCLLQKGHRYTFTGVFTAKFNSRLKLKPALALGEKFYVPGRPFSQNILPDSIVDISQFGNEDLYSFEYAFTATGNEQYLTFGTFIEEDTMNGKRFDRGQRETISLTVDAFELVADDTNEAACTDYETNKKKIYSYDFRHKEMDYSLYIKGELPIKKTDTGTGSITKMELPPVLPPVIAASIDTVLLGDVLFGFNEAILKPAATAILKKIFALDPAGKSKTGIDSIYVEGHTDGIGSEAQNMLLSRRRSQAVKDWLLKEGLLSADKISIHPFGKSRPVSTNATPRGRALNRRVEVIIFSGL